MKVVCDNCGAMYKIPDEKLVKPVNKATCRQCSHRMLIPRPRRGSDPDERTLVTAVPPTPAPPPPRDESGPSPSASYSEPGNEEKTLPVGGRSSVDETRWIRNEVKPKPQGRATPSTGGAAAAASTPPPGGAMTERVPAHGGASATPSQAPTPTPQRSVDLDTGTPLPVNSISPSEERGAGSKGKSSGKGRGAEPKPAHDPRGDMSLALFGVIVAGLGVLILGIEAVVDEGSFYWLVMVGAWLGTTLAVGGLTGAFLVLVTGGRGRKPAWKVLSVLAAILIGVLAGSVPASIRVGVDTAGTFSESLSGLVANGYTEPEPTLADLPDPADDGAADADDADEDEGDATEADTDEGEAADTTASAPPARTETTSSTPSSAAPTTRTSSPTTSSPPRTTTRTTTTSSGTSSPPPRIIEDRSSDTGSSTSRSGSRSAPIDETDLPDDLDDIPSAPSRPARSDLPERPPAQAIDVMVKTNVNVKRCFFEFNRAEGKLPNRLDVPFSIKPNGDATDISIKQGKYAGGELEACLIKAIRGITFPPSQKGTTITFPFVFQ